MTYRSSITEIVTLEHGIRVHYVSMSNGKVSETSSRDFSLESLKNARPIDVNARRELDNGTCYQSGAITLGGFPDEKDLPEVSFLFKIVSRRGAGGGEDIEEIVGVIRE
jgi:hypothetical protein